MAAPKWFNLRDLKRIARLARRLGLTKLGPEHDLPCDARVYRSRVWAIRNGALAEDTKRLRSMDLTFDGSEWDGESDACAHLFLDLIERAGYDASLLSRTHSEEKGYTVHLLDDDGENVDILACCSGETRTLAAAAMCLYVERLTRPRDGSPRWGPRRHRG